MASAAELDNPVWHALAGPHEEFAIANERAARYPTEVSPFAAIADPLDQDSWDDLAELCGDELAVGLFGIEALPDGWVEHRRLHVLQMVETAAYEPGVLLEDIQRLSSADVDGMIDLVDRTEPGPFARRTIDLGSYFGIRDSIGALASMAGERIATGSWREVSAVCTDPANRHKGFAKRLVSAVVADLRSRDERAFLHVMADNPARHLYASWGFEVHRELDIVVTSRTEARPS